MKLDELYSTPAGSVPGFKLQAFVAGEFFSDSAGRLQAWHSHVRYFYLHCSVYLSTLLLLRTPQAQILVVLLQALPRESVYWGWRRHVRRAHLASSTR